MKAIGKQIRQRREALGLTQVALAEKAGQSRNWISIIESKGFHNPSVGSLQAIADALDCKLVVKLKPRKAAEPDDPKDAKVQAKMQDIVAKIAALPWELTGPLGENARAHTLALLHDGDRQTAWAYLNLLQERVDAAFIAYAQRPDEPQNVGDWESLKRFMGVDYASAGADHTESIGIVRLDAQTITAEPPKFTTVGPVNY